MTDSINFQPPGGYQAVASPPLTEPAQEGRQSDDNRPPSGTPRWVWVLGALLVVLIVVTLTDGDRTASDQLSSTDRTDAVEQQGSAPAPAEEEAAPAPELVVVPDVVGDGFLNARAELRRLELEVSRRDVETTEAPPSTVMEQSETAGARLEIGDSVTLTVAKAPPPPKLEYRIKGIYDQAGVTLEMEYLRFLSRADIADMDMEYALEDSTKTVVVIDARLANDSGKKITWHPDQETLQIGREQQDGSLWLADGDLGGDINDGVDRAGTLVWEFEGSPEKLSQARKAVFTTESGPYRANDWEDIGPPASITLKWRRPSV